MPDWKGPDLRPQQILLPTYMLVCLICWGVLPSGKETSQISFPTRYGQCHTEWGLGHFWAKLRHHIPHVLRQIFHRALGLRKKYLFTPSQKDGLWNHDATTNISLISQVYFTAGSLDHNIDLQTYFKHYRQLRSHLNKKTGNIPCCYGHAHYLSVHEIRTKVEKNSSKTSTCNYLFWQQMARPHQCVWAAELGRPMGFLSRKKKNRSKQKAIEFSHCSMGKGRRYMRTYKYLSPPPAWVYSEEEASSDEIISMRGKRPPVTHYLLPNQIWYIIFI